eukprot:SAG22_NODE_6631_length_829_cov_1.256164_1_plen_157_part_10
MGGCECGCNWRQALRGARRKWFILLVSTLTLLLLARIETAQPDRHVRVPVHMADTLGGLSQRLGAIEARLGALDRRPPLHSVLEQDVQFAAAKLAAERKEQEQSGRQPPALRDSLGLAMGLSVLDRGAQHRPGGGASLPPTQAPPIAAPAVDGPGSV